MGRCRVHGRGDGMSSSHGDRNGVCGRTNDVGDHARVDHRGQLDGVDDGVHLVMSTLGYSVGNLVDRRDGYVYRNLLGDCAGR